MVLEPKSYCGELALMQFLRQWEPAILFRPHGVLHAMIPTHEVFDTTDLLVRATTAFVAAVHDLVHARAEAGVELTAPATSSSTRPAWTA
ncbi:MAG: hypothetical protein U1F43_12515 [Myxococcota bacterium]